MHVSVLIGWIPGACRHGRSFRVSAQQGQSGEGKRITQNEFTDKAWQSIIAAPDIAKQVCLLSSSRCLLRLLLQQWGLLIHLPTQGPYRALMHQCLEQLSQSIAPVQHRLM